MADRVPEDSPETSQAGQGSDAGDSSAAATATAGATAGAAVTAAAEAAERAFEDRARADAHSIRVALPALGHGLIATVLGLHAVATVVLSAVVFSAEFPYPVMYPLMGLIAWLFLAIRFTAWVGGRRISAAALFVFNLCLTAFWVLILADQVPGRLVVRDHLVRRDDTPVLWVPIALYAASAAVMVLHSVTRTSRRPA